MSSAEYRHLICWLWLCSLCLRLKSFSDLCCNIADHLCQHFRCKAGLGEPKVQWGQGFGQQVLNTFANPTAIVLSCMLRLVFVGWLPESLHSFRPHLSWTHQFGAGWFTLWGLVLRPRVKTGSCKVYVGLFVCVEARLDKNNSTDFHRTWWKDVMCVREETITFSCGSRSGDLSRIFFSLSLIHCEIGHFPGE